MKNILKVTKDLNVLCVEDEQIIREKQYNLLKEFFNKVDTAIDGEDALKKYQNYYDANGEYYDIIFTDIMMPNMDGHQLIDEIYSINADQVIVVVSAYSETERFIKLIDQGISNFLKKPLNLEGFLKTIEKVSQNVQRIKLIKKQEEIISEQSKMASLGEMIGNIAHQWRQPLQAISVITQKLQITQMMNKEVTQQDIIDMNDKVNQQLQYLTNTIDTFRNFLKTNKAPTQILIHNEIQNALNLVQTSLKNKAIQIIDDTDYKENIYYKLVPSELSQVIINILNNAKDILVENQIENAWIKLDVIKNETNITISIEDNGGGIPEDIINRVFEPYFTTKHQSQGTGLGLYMSYRITTESIKGKLYVQNTQNGAKFFIELPVE